MFSRFARVAGTGTPARSPCPDTVRVYKRSSSTRPPKLLVAKEIVVRTYEVRLSFINMGSSVLYFLTSFRRSVGQSVLVSGTHLGPATDFFLLSLIIYRQLRI
jgi:hypothetical protein